MEDGHSAAVAAASESWLMARSLSNLAALLRANHLRSRRVTGLANTVTMVALPVVSESTISTRATIDLFLA
jgi:hypothetical protein